jgi:hypothetical protein
LVDAVECPAPEKSCDGDGNVEEDLVVHDQGARALVGTGSARRDNSLPNCAAARP